jgi:lantibiotic modifying enzyme
VDAEVSKQANKWRVQTAQQMYSVVLKNLFDKYDFTPNMLWQFFERCTKDFDAIGDKFVKIEEFYSLLEDMGIKIV